MCTQCFKDGVSLDATPAEETWRKNTKNDQISHTREEEEEEEETETHGCIYQISMEASEENHANVSMKRQRTPLSDSEDDNLLQSEVSNGQKRWRLDVAGQEKPSPSSSGSGEDQGRKPDTPMMLLVLPRVQQLTPSAPSSSGSGEDHGRKPDTPMVPLVRSSVQQLTQRREGEGEFNQRMEQFKLPVFQSDSTLSAAKACPRTCSNFVSGIHDKLKDATPSSKQASRIRQEREQELNRLLFKPVSENAWFKRNTSNPLLSQEWTPPGPSTSSSVLRSRGRVQRPPVQPYDQVDSDADMKDGSFIEAPITNKEKQIRGGNVLATSEEKQLPTKNKTEGEEEPEMQTVLMLSFSENPSLSKSSSNEDQNENIAGDESKKEVSFQEESNKKKSSETFTLDEDKEEAKEACDNDDELLTFPPSGILSPLSKSIEAVVTPLWTAATQKSNPPSFLLTPEENITPTVESAPLYSTDEYRMQCRVKAPSIQSNTPGVQRRVVEKTQPPPQNTKQISALEEEAGKLQIVISQTLQVLSHCINKEHEQDSLEEAEAEKLLLVSCKKRSAVLAEVARLRVERKDYITQQPCKGTVSITNIQLPLKVEFVRSSHSHAGRPSHYFFVLICYGPCNIVATPLATAMDAQNGDTISFSTSVTLMDICSSFEIDVEVYSLSHTPGSICSTDQTTTKSRRSSNTLTAALPALNTHRSSDFSLVGSHKITLSSLGHSKFPLDKVPFLSPLEGNIYLKLDSESHSNVQHQGFLTMFKLIDRYGAWHRRYFILEGCNMFYWNYPNDKETKAAEGSVSLSSSPSQCVRPVKRDLCARPFTFELVSNVQQQEHQQDDNNRESFNKCWFSADTKQEHLDWMDRLNQALLDFHTWNRTENQQSKCPK